MTHDEMVSEIHRLQHQTASLQRQVRTLDHRLDLIEGLLRCVLEHLHLAKRPSAGILTVTFSGENLMNAVLIATLPNTRQDGSALAATDIASITFTKTPSGGVPSTMVTNSAADPTVGLTLDQLTVTDSNSNQDDSYDFLVTDTKGNAGAVSNVVTNPGVVAPPLSPPSAGTLTATFS